MRHHFGFTVTRVVCSSVYLFRISPSEEIEALCCSGFYRTNDSFRIKYRKKTLSPSVDVSFKNWNLISISEITSDCINTLFDIQASTVVDTACLFFRHNRKVHTEKYIIVCFK